MMTFDNRNKELKSQRQPNELVDSIRKLIRWLSFGVEPNLFIRYHPLRPLAHWYYARIVNRYVSRELDARFSMRKPESMKSTRTVIDLALSTYQKEQTDSEARVIDPLFKRICMAQVKLFLFSGHDTTSSSICYILYLLSKHPSISAKVREEIKQTFHSTPGTSSIAQQIAKNPYLLNQLPYITALIKESLRLFPVVSSTRCSPTPGASTLIDAATNLVYPLSPFLIWINPHCIHHDPRLWVKPDEFLPERWLVGREDPLYPVTGAWRAFEHGARNCIGRELAMVEMKTVVCLVVGRFVVRDVYGEEDRTRGKGIKSVEGERAYQVQLSQQEGDLPCRIERIKE
jgi:cytochrome P450